MLVITQKTWIGDLSTIEPIIFEIMQEKGVEAEFVIVSEGPYHGVCHNRVIDVRIGVKDRVSYWSDCQFLTLKAGCDLRKEILNFLIVYEFV